MHASLKYLLFTWSWASLTNSHLLLSDFMCVPGLALMRHNVCKWPPENSTGLATTTQSLDVYFILVFLVSSSPSLRSFARCHAEWQIYWPLLLFIDINEPPTICIYFMNHIWDECHGRKGGPRPTNRSVSIIDSEWMYLILRPSIWFRPKKYVNSFLFLVLLSFQSSNVPDPFRKIISQPSSKHNSPILSHFSPRKTKSTYTWFTERFPHIYSW